MLHKPNSNSGPIYTPMIFMAISAKLIKPGMTCIRPRNMLSLRDMSIMVFFSSPCWRVSEDLLLEGRSREIVLYDWRKRDISTVAGVEVRRMIRSKIYLSACLIT